MITQELKKTMTAATWYVRTSLVITSELKVCKMALREYKTIAAVANIASVSFQSCQNDFFSLIDIPPSQYFLIQPVYHQPWEGTKHYDSVSSVQAFLGRRGLS
jgi:hypothetical protein